MALPTDPQDNPSSASDNNEEPGYTNDDLDDIFGSAPGSPVLGHDTNLDREPWRIDGNTEISDIPRLKEKHETEGYRDGITKGKAGSVQVGFDEGYNLGAVLGLRIGKILGVLEGVVGALRAGGQRERVEGLLGNAKEELGTRSVFGPRWWGEDGIWKFVVEGEGDGKEVVFGDVAGSHPLVRKWEGVVEEEVRSWGLDFGVMGEDLDSDVEATASSQEAAGGGQNAESKGASKPKAMGIPKEDLNC